MTRSEALLDRGLELPNGGSGGLQSLLAFIGQGHLEDAAMCGVGVALDQAVGTHPGEDTMTVQQEVRGSTSRGQMDALVDSHYRAEETCDLQAIVAGFTADAEHDVIGRPGDTLHGGEEIKAFYAGLLAELRIDRFEPVRRWYGDDHVVDESVLHATAQGWPFGLEGRGRSLRARFLHIFDFTDGLISRESAWIDLVAIQLQLAD